MFIEYYIAENGRSYYQDWLSTLAQKPHGIILDHVTRLAVGLGELKPLGQGLSELRIHYGPGYRVYFERKDKNTIIVYAGSDKSGQKRTIRLARKLMKERKEQAE